ncbi:MAG TPA: ABC transporter permease [Thermoanaerobaculia bacterium]|nr:ABC transporter permease [Thermoanaerobaculia bacterium]
METLLQDLRFAGRTLLKRPAFTLIAVLTLALGIGANTAIFSVVDSVLLAPLPFRETDRLMVIWESNPELAAKVGFPDKLPVSPATFFDWKTAKAFEKMAMAGAERLSLTGEGEPELLGAVRVSGEFFQVLGTPPLLGRTLLPEDDDDKGKPTTVVLSHALWQRRFGGDRQVVGKTVRLDGNPLTVVGVMPAPFTFPRGAEVPRGYGFAAQPDVWVPMALPPERRQNRGNRGQLAIGLLAPGVTRAVAQAEMSTIGDRVEKEFPDSDKGWRPRVDPLPEQLVGDVRPALLILLAAVGLVLLIACVNVANLLLAQAAARQKEIAVRTALGAGRGRMVRQLLTESALLSLLGAALGLLFAYWGLRAFALWIPEDIPISRTIALDLRILGFTLVVALITGALAGLMPAFQMTRPDLAESLRDGTRAGSGTSRGGRTRNALVVLETAVAVLLVVGAGLLIRSFARLSAVDPGFRPEGVLSLQVLLPESKYPEDAQQSAFTEAVLEKLQALPGVSAAGMVSNLPMSGEENIEGFVIEGRPKPKPEEQPFADYRRVSTRYFETMGVRRVRGRIFSAGDAAKAPHVAVIDETMARAFWPGTDPIGKRFRFGTWENTDEPWITIVGIVGNVRHSGLHVDPRPQLYIPQAQIGSGSQYFVLRTQGDPKRLTKDARAAVFAVDPDQPVAQVRTMEQRVGESVAGRRFNTVLLGVFAVLALVLAAVGIYGITSYSVAQRTREMGLRMALGAKPGTVLRMVLREAGALALTGLAAGLLLAFAATRVMASLLFGVPATDPATFAGVAAGLALVSFVAAYLPGRRATRVDPMVALRAD